MGTKYVNSLTEMNNENRLWYRRVKASQTNMLHEMGNVNSKVSKMIAKEVSFQGTLVASIILESLSETKVRVISSTEHGYGIEKGLPPIGGPLKLKSKTMSGNWITFAEQPLLETWVRSKLMSKSPDKAKLFLRLGAVNVGQKGYPFSYPRGIRFMETGYFSAVSQSNSIVSSELLKLNV